MNAWFQHEKNEEEEAEEEEEEEEEVEEGTSSFINLMCSVALGRLRRLLSNGSWSLIIQPGGSMKKSIMLYSMVGKRSKHLIVCTGVRAKVHEPSDVYFKKWFIHKLGGLDH